jgi:dihydroxyacetone kinase-like predicted kinase
MRHGTTLHDHLKNIGQSKISMKWDIKSETNKYEFQRMFKFNEHTQLLNAPKSMNFLKEGIIKVNIRDYIQLSNEAQCSYLYQLSEAKKDMADRLTGDDTNMTVVGQSKLDYYYDKKSTWIGNISEDHLIEPWYTNSVLYFFLSLIGLAWLQKFFIKTNTRQIDIFFLKYIIN